MLELSPQHDGDFLHDLGGIVAGWQKRAHVAAHRRFRRGMKAKKIVVATGFEIGHMKTLQERVVIADLFRKNSKRRKLCAKRCGSMRFFFFCWIGLFVVSVAAQDAVLRPYEGPSEAGVGASTLTGKVMCGYQGWFNCEGDGADLGWTHWAKSRRELFGPGNVTVDLWPDVSEYGDDELFETGFQLADGSSARVFSSFKKPTVMRHFEWMRDYGIDGAFVQRFANGLANERTKHHKDVVLANAREGANRAGRAYAVMYDLSGLKAGVTKRVAVDWRKLREKMQITEDAAYLKHEGKPLVAVWGVGFSDDREYSLKETGELIRFLKDDGCSVMLGVPYHWQSLDKDAVSDPMLHKIIAMADVVSPWSIGRYRSPKQAGKFAEQFSKPDLEWCSERDLDFLPVVFPGFSWHNMTGEDLGAIPRLKGEFLWSQFAAAKRIGCEMIYVAMFDEVDEGTAIFKCTNEPPVGEGVSFLDYEGLPSDFYLRLTGEGGRLLRGEIPLSDQVPSW